MASQGTYRCACIILAILTGVGIIMFAVSIHTVQLNHIAIVQNKFNKSIDDTKIYQSGRYLIGLTSKYFNQVPGLRELDEANHFRSGEQRHDSFDHQWRRQDFDRSDFVLHVSAPELAEGGCQRRCNSKIYVKWPAEGRHEQDLSKTAKENIAKTINKYSYVDFLVKRNEISRSIAKDISTDYSNQYYTDVSFTLLYLFLYECSNLFFF